MMKKLIPVISISLILISCGTQQIMRTVDTYPVNLQDNFLWGIDGHPVTKNDYLKTSIDQQIKIIKEHQFDYYGFEILTDKNGNLTENEPRFNELLQKLKSNNIQPITCLIIYHLIDYKASEESAYHAGLNQAKGFAEKYGKHYNYYILGNQEEIPLLLNEANGTRTTEYDYQKFKVLASYLQGMIDGVRSADPTAKTIINMAGWLHWGYFDLLQQAGVNYDILGFHWYSNMGSMQHTKRYGFNVLNELSRFNKPLWITETNKGAGSMNNTETEQKNWVSHFMDEINGYKNIKAMAIYELYDEPTLKNQEWAGEKEANYGIIKWRSNPPNYTQYQNKEVSRAIKYRIEEAKYGHEDYIYAVLEKINNAPPAPGLVRAWAEKFKRTPSIDYILSQILAESNQTTLNTNIEETYKSILKRQPNETEKAYWTKEFSKKRPKANLTKTLFMSEEFWQSSIWSGYERRTGYERPK